MATVPALVVEEESSSITTTMSTTSSSAPTTTIGSFFGGDENATTNDYDYYYYDHEITTLSDSQEKLIVLLQILTATLSIVGSSTIIQMAYNNNNNNNNHNNNKSPRNNNSSSSSSWSTYTRLLVSMSISDIVLSTSFAISAFLLPKDSSQRVWAFGTDGTCTIMGSLLQLSSIGILYNGMLSYYFVLAAKYKVTKSNIARFAEPLMHLIAIGYPLVTSIWGAVLGVYHETELGQTCWVANYPENCGEAPGESGVPCKSTLLGYVFGAVVVGFTFLSLLFNNLAILFFVRKQSLQIPNNKSSSKKVNMKTTTTRLAAAAVSLKNSIPFGGGNNNKNNNSSNIIINNNETRSSTGDVESPTIGHGDKEEYVDGYISADCKRSNTTMTDDNDDNDNDEEWEDEDEDFLDEKESGDDSKKTNNNNNNNNQEEDMTILRKKQLKRLQLVATQSYLYVAAFMLSSIWPTLVRILESLNYNKVDESKLYPILICQAIFFPLQGLFNLLVFARPRYIQCRLQHPNVSRMRAFQIAIHGRRHMLNDDRNTGNKNRLIKQIQQQQQQQPRINEVKVKEQEQDHGVGGPDVVAAPKQQKEQKEQQKRNIDLDEDEQQLQLDQDDDEEEDSSMQSTTQKLMKDDEEEQRNHVQQHHHQQQQGRSCFVRAKVSSLTTTSFDLADDDDDTGFCHDHYSRKITPLCKDSRHHHHHQQQQQCRPIQPFCSAVSSLTLSINEEFNNTSSSSSSSSSSVDEIITDGPKKIDSCKDVPILPAQRRRSILRWKKGIDSTREPFPRSSLDDDDTSTIASSSVTTKRVRFSTATKPHVEHSFGSNLPIRFQTTNLTSVVESHRHQNILLLDEEIDISFDRMGAIGGNSNHTSSLSSSNNNNSNDTSLKIPERRHSTGSSSSSSTFSSPSSFDEDEHEHEDDEEQSRQMCGGVVRSPIKNNHGSNVISTSHKDPPKLPARKFRGSFPPSNNISTTIRQIQQQVGVLYIHGDTIQPGYIPSYDNLRSIDSKNDNNDTAAPLRMESGKKSLTAKGA